MKTLFFDESGNTGQNLADLAQPVFTLVSTTIEAGQAQQLISRFDVLKQKELKYSKVRKTGRGRQLLMEFMREPEISGSTTKVYIVNKPFMIVSKIVDMIYEPQLHEMGENFYEKKAALATANLLVTTCPVFAGRTRFYRVLELFVRAARAKDDASIDRFFGEVAAMKEYIEKKHGKSNAEMLIPLSYEEFTHAPNIRRGISNELDPIIPSFKIHADYWSNLSAERFEVVSDNSSSLEKDQQLFLEYSSPLGTPVTADYYGQKIKYPLKINRFRFVDSRTEPSIRVADLIAGIANEALSPIANREKPSEHERALAKCLFDNDIVLGAIWPSDDVTPETLEADGGSAVNPVQLAADFIGSVRNAAKKTVE